MQCVSGICYQKMCPPLRTLRGYLSVRPGRRTLFYSEVYGKYSIARVAIINERIVGYIIARLILDEGHLLDLAVCPEFRMRGIARMLMEDVISGLQINRCKAFFLEVRALNSVALKLYEEAGFRVIGTRKNYYKAPVEDACIMMRDLAVRGVDFDSVNGKK